MTTETAKRNPFKEREALRADIVKAREANDRLQADLRRFTVERRQADAELHRHEMAVIAGEPDALEHRDTALERIRTTDPRKEECDRGLAAARQLVEVREAQLSQLYDQEFSSFATEAEAATMGALHELEAAREQIARASQAWAKASALWRPLNVPLRRRLEELNEEEGAYPNVAPQAVIGMFPVQIPDAAVAPRPPGMDRLRGAGRL